MGLSEAERRLALVWWREVAAHTGDRRRAHHLLVVATR
ncbi:MAG: hypothetical protein AVDCRST_MAG02-1704 [uncultured Rubrobacteraceae bacterium]|uniref:Uncharacterized protein n=1 Tax=uncultured Rubrobacteraceae bacterium TaxID=349277 RepID=A0A6J4QYW5_9ACTN|nr:MAG: hypothetical protein AVDCRST_MAG02-1704 [uncultured Rubrobacteraceae bacterium]